MATVRVGKQHQHFLFDNALAPVATAASGDEVVFETLDACCGEVRTAEQLRARQQTARPSNPVNGPVFVTGAAPGDTLVVEILRVELDADGFQLIGPNRAIVRDEVPDWTCYAFAVRGDRLVFPNGFELPADPVIGQLGTAPAGRPTNEPNPHGGNLDCPAIRVGARVYLPVAVPGALFSLGDVHARQGDGEVVGAPEIGARVTARLELRRGRHSEWPMIEDATHWHSCWAADTEAEAARQATFQNAAFLQRTEGLELKDALVLLTLIGELRISRTAKWGTHNPVVCASFAKAAVREAVSGKQRT